jgi:hypothetical protein
MADQPNEDGAQADPLQPESDFEIESLNLTPEEWEIIGDFGQLLSELDVRPLSQYTKELHFYQAHHLFEFFLAALEDERMVFRGHSDAAWPLWPTAERLCKGRPAGDAEEYVLAAFKRRAHQYLTDLPHSDDTLEWLALAQHYGAPTSLLDVTRSPYVATFFATRDLPERKPSAVWAFDKEILKLEARHRLSGSDEFFKTAVQFGSPDAFNRLFPRRLVRSGSTASIVPVEPIRMNERLTIQQGLFLYPSSIW